MCTRAPEVQPLGRGLHRDRVAVEAALSSEWSTGQVEGQIHQLAVNTRSMYSRATLDLLRLCILDAAQLRLSATCAPPVSRAARR